MVEPAGHGAKPVMSKGPAGEAVAGAHMSVRWCHWTSVPNGMGGCAVNVDGSKYMAAARTRCPDGVVT